MNTPTQYSIVYTVANVLYIGLLSNSKYSRLEIPYFEFFRPYCPQILSPSLLAYCSPPLCFNPLCLFTLSTISFPLTSSNSSHPLSHTDPGTHPSLRFTSSSLFLSAHHPLQIRSNLIPNLWVRKLGMR